MKKELDLLRQHRPTTSGPEPEVTERATRSFGEFLDSQTPTVTIRHTRPTRRQWLGRPLAIAGLATTLLAAGGIAIAVISDGVVYVDPATRITETDGLTLVVQDSNKGLCLEVRSDDGSMSGGCGFDFDTNPLGVNLGLVNGKTFASGWAPPGTVKVVMTFPDGETMEVTAIHVVEGYDVVFFVASPSRSPGYEETVLPDAAAYDVQGNTLATVSYSD